MDLGAMARKGDSAFPKALALLEPHHQVFLISYPENSLEESYLYSEMQLVSSAAPAESAISYF